MTTAEAFQTEADKTLLNMQRIDAIVNGDENAEITVDGGRTIPSFAKLQRSGGSSESTVVSLGNVSGELTLDFTKDGIYELTATGTINLPNPTTSTPSALVLVYITQDGTGGRSLAPGSAFEWDTDSQLSAASGVKDLVIMHVQASGHPYLTIHNFKGGGPGATRAADDIEFTASADGAQVHTFAGTRARVYLEGLLLPSSSHTIATHQLTIGTAAQVRTGDHIRITAY